MPKSFVSIITGVAFTFLLIFTSGIKTAFAQQRIGIENKLLPADAEANMEFGKSVALYGNTAIVGAQSASQYQGAVYVYQFNGSDWIQSQKLIASDAAEGNADEFGVDVDIEGNTAMVGATFNEDNGAVYVFEYDGVAWIETQKLQAQSPIAFEGFGQSLALSGNTLLVGTFLFDAPGRALIFEFNGTEWQEMQELKPLDSASGDFFGISVSLSDDKAVIGTVNGTAYVFHREGGNWIQKQKLEPSDPGADAFGFGRSVAIDGSSMLIARQRDNINGSNSGSAYIFEYDGTLWSEKQKIKAEDGAADDGFGTSIHLNQDLILVGAPGNNQNRGAAYMFEYDGAGWVQKYKLIKGDNEGNDPGGSNYGRFGNSVFITPNRALVGSWVDAENGVQSGSAYLYEFMAQPGSVTAADGESNNQIRISWNNRTKNADGFRIYRDGVEIGSTVLAATVFNDLDAIPGKLYDYHVTAYNNFWGESPPSFADFGWRRANGTIQGVVQTERSATITDVDVTAEPVDSTLGQSLDFDGVNDHVVLPPVERSDNMTVSAWIKTSSSADQQILAWGNTANAQKVEFKTTGGQLTYSESGTVAGAQVVGSQLVNTGGWQHVALVITDDVAQLYINGAAGTPVSGIRGNADVNTLTIGAIQAGPDFLMPFNGGVDDLQLWNRALSGDEILRNMYYELKGNEGGLVAYWSFNDSTRSGGSVAGDYAQGGNHHGRIVGAAWSSQSAPVAYRDLTDADGEFSIGNLFYDESREFRVTPLKPDHLFDPEYRDVVLESGGGPNISFNDTTVFTVSGQIIFAGTDCPVEGVELFLDGEQTGVFTGDDGQFDLAIEDPGQTYEISPQFGDSSTAHRFSPEKISVLVEGDVDGLLFEDTERHLLYGKVRGGCIAGLGTAQLRVSSLQNSDCLDTTITTDYSGNYRIFFPAQEYKVDLIHIDNPDSTNILNYFDPMTVDITWENKSLILIYRPKPIVRLEILPTEYTCDDVPLLRQYQPYNVLIDVLEAYQTDTCHVSGGFVAIYDDIGGNPAEPAVIGLENGRAIYQLVPGEPNILGGGDHPYQKLLRIEANVDDQISVFDQWALVTGQRARTQTFFSKATPELPLMILRDPPGDQSFSFLSKGSTYTINSYQSLDSSRAGPPSDLPNFLDLNIGVIFSIGWGSASEVTSDVGSYYKLAFNRFSGDGVESLSGSSISLSMTEELRTSDDEAVTGASGDVIIGAALNQTFFIADIIDYDPDLCRVIKDTSLAFTNTGYKSTYVYTDDHIRNTLIPQLQELQQISGPESAFDYANAIFVWQQVLQYNDSLKNEAQSVNGEDDIPDPHLLLERNISFSGGTSTTQYATLQSQEYNSLTYKQTFDSDFLVGLGAVIGGPTTEFGWQWRWQTVHSQSNDTSNTSETTVGYTLADDDAGDFFSVDVLQDPTYGTPVFNLVAGTSSCPWEPGTQPRDGVQLGIDTDVQRDVPPGEPATFTLTLGNTSESGEARPYDLRMIQLSNPDGAVIKVGGVPMGDALSYFIPAGDSAFQATLTVDRGPRAYDYENLQIMMVPPCEWDAYNSTTAFADTVTFSVHFASPLSDANLTYPQDNWQITAAETDSLPVVISGYNIRNDYLRSIKFQYRRPEGSWVNAFTVPKEALPAQNLTRYWNYENLPDGDYQLRVLSDGGPNGVRYSTVAQGHIERHALLVTGVPEPADQELNRGESIAVSFAAGIDTEKLNSKQDIALTDTKTGVAVPFSAVVQGNTLLIEPEVSFQELAGRQLTARVTNITDPEGNRLLTPVTWQFWVNQAPAYIKSLATELYAYEGQELVQKTVLFNSGTDPAAYRITHLPEWLVLDIGAVNGEIASGAECILTLKTADGLAVGMLSDSISIMIGGQRQMRSLELHILTAPPQWSTDTPMPGTYVTQVYVQLLLNDRISDDSFDIAGLFIDNKLSGTGHVRYDQLTAQYQAAFQVYNNAALGSPIEFRLWDASEGKEYRYYDDQLIFQAGIPIGTRNNPLIIQPNEVTQMIDVTQGWNWISYNVVSGNLSLQNYLHDYIPQPGDLLKNQSAFSVYSEESGWTGTLDYIQPGTSYHLRSQSGGELRSTGRRADSWVTPSALQPGWNWIGYLPDRPLHIADALYFLQAVPGDMIRYRDKSAVYNNNGEWLGTLQEMTPGRGYLLYSQANSQLIYPDLKKAVDYDQKPDWQVDAYQYESSMTMIAGLKFDGVEYGDSTKIIAAFVDGECRGVANMKYLSQRDDFVTFMMIYGDPSDKGKSVQFQVFESSSGIIRDIEEKPVFDPDFHYGTLEEPFQLIALQTDAERIPTDYYLKQNYPNPFNPVTTIEYGLPQDGNVNITVYNLLGQRVAVLVNKRQAAGRYRLEFDAETAGIASGIYFYKIQAGSFVKSFKMLLLK